VLPHIADAPVAGGDSTTPTGSSLASATAVVPFPATTGRLAQQQQQQGPYAWRGECGVCRQELSVILGPRFVHGSSNVLGGLKVCGCQPLDLLPSVLGRAAPTVMLLELGAYR